MEYLENVILFLSMCLTIFLIYLGRLSKQEICYSWPEL